MVEIFKDPEALSVAAAELFVAAAKKAIDEKGKFTVALTGGSSPAKLYKLLASAPYSEQVDWQKVFIFWGDERWVPLDDEKSNAKMTKELLLDQVNIPENQIFPMWTDGKEPESFAKEYAELLHSQLGSSGSFDLIFLGMGDDGHTASLFPGTAVLAETEKWVAAYFLVPQDMYRITLTAPVLNKAKQTVVLVFGANKAKAFHEVQHGTYNPELYPSQLLKPEADSELIWFVDSAAAEN